MMNHHPDPLREDSLRRFQPEEHRSGESDGVSPSRDLWLHSALRSYPVWKIDKMAFVRRMDEEMESPSGAKWYFHFLFSGLRRWSAVMAGIAVILVCLLISAYLVVTPISHPARHVELYSEATSAPQPVSWLWEKRLQRGCLVIVPPGVYAVLQLADGSTVQCSPESRVALPLSRERRITLQSGILTVQAAHIPKSTMTVTTPLAEVRVVGTVFWVEVVR